MSQVRDVTYASGLDTANTGGRGGIRTHGALAGTPVFKTGALNHSATLPSLEFSDLAGARAPGKDQSPHRTLGTFSQQNRATQHRTSAPEPGEFLPCMGL